MDLDSIVLRAGQPTFDDGLACGHYIDQAAEGFYTFMLGPRSAHVIAAAYVQPDHDYSFENVTFAEYDEKIVGMALGFTAEQHRRSSDRALRESPGYPAFRVRVVRTLLAPLFRILETVADGDFYLLAIATDKEMRGKGIGSALMNSTEERARARHSSRLSLDVSAKNEAARRLYERWGMSVESQWPRRLSIPALRLYRMTKAL